MGVCATLLVLRGNSILCAAFVSCYFSLTSYRQNEFFCGGCGFFLTGVVFSQEGNIIGLILAGGAFVFYIAIEVCCVRRVVL